MWWCGKCQRRLTPPEVGGNTDDEFVHDVRMKDGCGEKVEWIDPNPPVCEECQRGIHKHLDSMKEKWFPEAPMHEKLDAIDCKNIIDDDNQCCCPETSYFHKRIVNEG